MSWNIINRSSDKWCNDRLTAGFEGALPQPLGTRFIISLIWLKSILNSLAAIVTAGGFVPWEGVLDQERHSRYTDVVWMHAVVMPWSGGTTKTGSWMRNMVSSVTLLEVDCGNWRLSKFWIWVAPHLTFMFDQDECMLKLGTDFGKKMLPDLQCQKRVESETPFWRIESCLLGMLHVRALGDFVCSSVMWVCFKIDSHKCCNDF